MIEDSTGRIKHSCCADVWAVSGDAGGRGEQADFSAVHAAGAEHRWTLQATDHRRTLQGRLAIWLSLLDRRRALYIYCFTCFLPDV